MAPGELALAGLLEAAHLRDPVGIAGMLVEHAAPIGVRGGTVYLADLRQETLVPLPDERSSDREPLRIDATLAGLAYRVCKVFDTDLENGERQVWLPLLDGAERLGVLELVVGRWDETTLRRCRALASLMALLVVAKRVYSDTYAQVRRQEPMALSAEMEWALMPPLTLATEDVVVSGVLEPAYDVGGDAFDYALTGDTLNAATFDAVGHDLQSGLTASVGMAACRKARRDGADLAGIAGFIDEAIAEQFDNRYLTGLLCHLHVPNGTFHWINCGHPAPLLIRAGRVVKVLDRTPRVPLGLGAVLDLGPHVSAQHEEHLQPGDRILIYTDGVIEARSPEGDFFGLQRLADFVIRHTGEHMPAPEALRRLVRGILEHQEGRLSDDATIVLIEWAPPDRGRNLLP